MAMELFSMDSWHVFFNSEEELNQAKEHQLERVLTILPWIATVDKFQHWIYENPNHSLDERAARWMEILNEFSSSVLDTSDTEEYRRYSWQKQLHLYEVPFYYIEYGIAQLGAIGLWKQFKENPQQALSNYTNALSLGGTRTLPELFQTAGLRFDFSPSAVGELMNFVHKELTQIARPI
jgi:oligoendopeptidase F